MPTDAEYDAMKNSLIQHGGSKTIYAFVMPQMKAVLNTVLDGKPDEVDGRETLHEIYEDPWTGKQDAAHVEFFNKWKSWSSPVLQWDPQSFPFNYPTAGASEGLREIVHTYGHTARRDSFTPNLHVFDGEYEGYKAYADAAFIKVGTHKRSDWRGMIDMMEPTDMFFISQPSAIDGNLWADYDEFMQTLHEKKPGVRVVLDLTYVGAVAKDYRINADYPNIDQIIFSLSKPMGVYYHRIGGVMSREAMPSLWGNIWFKNLLALKLGTSMMNTYGVHDLPRHYAATQAEAARHVAHNLSLDLKLSDVWLLATAKPKTPITRTEEFLLRGAKENPEAVVRVCLSPEIDRIIKPHRYNKPALGT